MEWSRESRTGLGEGKKKGWLVNLAELGSLVLFSGGQQGQPQAGFDLDEVVFVIGHNLAEEKESLFDFFSLQSNREVPSNLSLHPSPSPHYGCETQSRTT